MFFDSSSSPIRMIQRLGRTGRARDGKCIILINEGCENDTFAQAQARSKSLTDCLKESKTNKNGKLVFSYASLFNKMLPDGVLPVNEWVDFSSKKSFVANEIENVGQLETSLSITLGSKDYKIYRQKYYLTDIEATEITPNFEKYLFLILVLLFRYMKLSALPQLVDKVAHSSFTLWAIRMMDKFSDIESCNSLSQIRPLSPQVS